MDKSKVLELLSKFISIQSVSADSKRRKEITKAVDFLKNQFKEMGVDVKIIQKGQSPPLILGIYHSDHGRDLNGNRKTIGIYGHYDIQPEDPVDEWESPPFELTIKDGKLYGRGVADNKGHVIQNLTSIKHLIKVNKLKNNIVFIFEGEEEVGSDNFENYVKEAKDILSRVDVFYVTDTGMYKKNIPQIFYGLRGLVYFELEVDIGNKDLHSGIYGNRVLNPVQILAHLLAKMKDEKTNKVLIPGFYNEVRSITQDERNNFKSFARSDEEEKKTAGVYKMISLDKDQAYLSSKFYPSLDVNGIVSGHTREGAKTIIPRKATLKFSCRLVENQHPDKIKNLVGTFIKNNLPKGTKHQLKVLFKDHPFYTDSNNNYIKKTADILQNYFGNKTLLNRSGGSIPAAEILQRLYKKPIILTGFTLPDDNIHSPNENFDEEMFWKGIEALKLIYSL